MLSPGQTIDKVQLKSAAIRSQARTTGSKITGAMFTAGPFRHERERLGNEPERSKTTKSDGGEGTIRAALSGASL